MLIGLLALGFALQPVYAGQKGHAHGRGHINIAIEADGKTGVLEFESPAESIYGFEHTAKTDKDKKAVADGLALLETKIGTIVQFAAEAVCTFTKNAVETKTEDHKEEHKTEHKKADKHKKHDHKARGHEDHGHEDHGKKHSEHAEVRAEFGFSCQKSVLGTKLTFAISEVFPALKQVQVQVVGEKLQKGLDVKGTGSLDL